MSTQIAVRLPDEIVAYLDQQVASGDAPSRAAVVTRALERERRRGAAERDARIYAAAAGAGELDDLATWAASQPLDLD
ncbi:MAG TPA: YlcI/YnfO family protein [Actinomycetes bacterium]|jgi:Arc/MetJ-type ribon-helix-helix transcriptional regulator